MTCGFHGAAACRACLLHWGTKTHKHTRCRTGICRFCGFGQQSSLQGVKWRTQSEEEREGERERDRVWLRVKATEMPSQPQAISCWGYYWSFQGALWTCFKGNPMCHLKWKIWWTQWETDQHKRHFCTAKIQRCNSVWGLVPFPVLNVNMTVSLCSQWHNEILASPKSLSIYKSLTHWQSELNRTLTHKRHCLWHRTLGPKSKYLNI